MSDIADPPEFLARLAARSTASHTGSGGQPNDLALAYRVSDFFVARSPAYALDRLLAWSSDASPAPLTETASERWAARCTTLTARLCNAFSAPWLRRATFFASPELEQLVSGLEENSQLPPKLVRTLTRYLMRAAGRETPFGLFAGVSLGKIAEHDCFELSSESSYRPTASVALSYLNQILMALGARHQGRDGLQHELNSTLVWVNGSYRFATAEPAVSPSEEAQSTLLQLVATPEIDRAVALARNGVTPEELARSIARGRAKYADELVFARTMCERGLLVPFFLPAATGSSRLASAVAQLSRHPPLAEAAELLGAVERELIQAGLEPDTQRYRAVGERLGQLALPPAGVHPLQVELGKPAPNLAMSQLVASLFLDAATLIQRTSRNASDHELTEFRERFLTRYDSRLVPLSEALDSEFGIDFGGAKGAPRDSLLADISGVGSKPAPFEFDDFDGARLKLLCRALARRQVAYELDDETLADFPMRPGSNLPESFAVIARLARRPDGEVSVVAPMLMAPTALTFNARFCDAEPRLTEVLRRHAANEQQLAGDELLADVAYLPLGISANVVVRPVLREYEIAYLGKSGAAPEKQIPISDLYVGVSGDRVFLYSARHQKRVKIRITHALNSAHPSHPTVYRFFGALQAQDESSLASCWSWGALIDSEFLPRVVRGGTVLSLARWRLSSQELKAATSAEGANAFARLQELRETRGLPRWLTRPVGDQRLPIDLDNELSVDELLDEAKKRPFVVLEEMLPAPGESVLSGPEGGYAGEFVVPFLRRASAPAAARPAAPLILEAAAERRRAIGSDWLYAKIYAAPSRLDAILEQIRADVLEPLLGNAIKLWFYLPYADPQPHLRIRFQGAPSGLRSKVLPALQRALAPALSSGVAWRLQLDTYEQEQERYGGPQGVKLAEQVFCADSEACSELVEACGEDSELRWQAVLLGIDRLLSDCSFDLGQRLAVARSASEAYGDELGADIATWKAIGAKFRSHAPRLTELLALTRGRATRHDKQLLRIFELRSARITPIWRELERGRAAGEIETPAVDLALSFTHMHAIRLLGTEARSHELVLFEFLKRLYVTRAARAANADSPLTSLRSIKRGGARR